MWRGATEAPPFLTGGSMILANDERGRRIGFRCAKDAEP